jgi:hypothetical protein
LVLLQTSLARAWAARWVQEWALELPASTHQKRCREQWLSVVLFLSSTLEQEWQWQGLVPHITLKAPELD